MISKKVPAFISAFFLIYSLLSFTVSAHDERNVIVVYPGFKSNGRTTVNGDGTPSGGGRFMFANIDDTAGTNGFAQTDSRIERAAGSLQSSSTTGYTNFLPGTLSAHKGLIYKPCASDETNSSGWYDVYVERLVYYDSSSFSMPDAIHADVIHKNGISHYLMDMTPTESYREKTKHADLVKIGTFYFSNASVHQVRLFLPICKNSGSEKVRFDFGGVMFVPSVEPSEKEYCKPVFSDDLSDGISAAWYEAVGDTVYSSASSSAEIPAGSSLKINYADGEDAAEAVKFTQGAINFRIWWRNTEKNDAYTSVILGKSADKKAEFRICSDKAEYVENDNVKCEIPIHGYYEYYYNTKSENNNKYTLSGYYDDETETSYYPHMMRLEISQPEALSTTDTADITDDLKTVRIIVNYGSANAFIMALGSLPADSILNNTDYDDPADNYIEFKNTAGISESSSININEISVMIPDFETVSGKMYAGVINRLEYTKSDNELSKTKGLVYVQSEVISPAEITNTVLKSNTNPGIAIMAPYSASGMLSGAPVVRSLNILPGTKKKTTMALDADPDEMSKIKFFIWDSLSGLVPVKESEIALIY